MMFVRYEPHRLSGSLGNELCFEENRSFGPASAAGCPGGKLVWVPCASSPVALVEIHEGWALVEDAAGQMHAVPADQVDCAETL